MDQLRMESAVARELAKAHGGVVIRNGQFTTKDGAVIDEAELAPLRAKVVDDDLKAAISAEALRRIMAVLNNPLTQINIALHAALLAEKKADKKTAAKDDDDLAAIKDIVAWIKAMRTKARELRQSGAQDFMLDTHWPPAPAGAKEFADGF